MVTTGQTHLRGNVNDSRTWVGPQGTNQARWFARLSSSIRHSTAPQTIDGEIAQLLAIRKKQIEGVGPPFFDANTSAQGYMGLLPKAFCPNPGCLFH
ncbi:hypothetical protein LguiA_014019 [Lonicera macranthoides]